VARRFSIGSGQCHGTAQQGSMSVGRGLGSAALGGSAEVGWCEVAVGLGCVGLHMLCGALLDGRWKKV